MNRIKKILQDFVSWKKRTDSLMEKIWNEELGEDTTLLQVPARILLGNNLKEKEVEQ